MERAAESKAYLTRIGSLVRSRPEEDQKLIPNTESAKQMRIIGIMRFTQSVPQTFSTKMTVIVSSLLVALMLLGK